MRTSYLTAREIALLAQTPSEWTSASEVGVDVRLAEWRSLAAAALVLERTWPPPPPGVHRASRSARAASGSMLERTTQVRRTLQGSERLERIQRGRRTP